MVRLEIRVIYVVAKRHRAHSEQIWILNRCQIGKLAELREVAKIKSIIKREVRYSLYDWITSNSNDQWICVSSARFIYYVYFIVVHKTRQSYVDCNHNLLLDV